MVRDLTCPIRRRRRRPWQRDPRLLAAGAACAVAGLVLLGGDVYGGASSGPQSFQVHRGDTLWSIAAVRYPGDDARVRVAQIITANHLRGAEISPGETLTLPAP